MDNTASLFDVDYVDAVSANRRSVSKPLSLVTGTGYRIYRDCILPSIRAAEQEVILVTCFWASSTTRNLLHDELVSLSQQASTKGPSNKICVHICFSSSSMARNMLLPTPEHGQRYSSKEWYKLGLPRPHQISNLNLRITRKFYRPFGIIHSKYVIIDRKLAIFPSCNVSWERWYEAALVVEGPVVQDLLSFHSNFWEYNSKLAALAPSLSNGNIKSAFPTTLTRLGAPATLLPSPHTPGVLPDHLRPRSLFGICSCLPAQAASYPPTPLLAATHHLIATAQTSITMITPNLTAPAVLHAMDEALERGVHIVLHTNRNLMTLEQLVTAGTTTPRCVKKLKRLSGVAKGSTAGRLDVHYFDERSTSRTRYHGRARDVERAEEADNVETVPVKLHAKVTIVDDKRIMFGSGNMDAASWKTSQELGVLIESEEVVEEFSNQWEYGSLVL